ncbi:hypothetical protein CONCODRAFT_56887 [Conidiobolus coronatus NRRL 28638]|uniref:Uncharacterized protein n=1 Tax=Conidiobolus coronatus (strain ATCC 28846 / CBS 209.66 / NRRL 28638) TaxID=796925 RepID=A0A137PAD2_CONC2|nr:hypothetical protein CONCODRAFT_56887 [Conidiobolus coronatus NRRL 28638]|eukprot:KXN71969.1 hypothetical protein CONCODRAFT_56887 [Conidiobolus coronatus NRRL 28638]
MLFFNTGQFSFWLWLSCLSFVFCNFSQASDGEIVCSGMYSKDGFRNPQDSKIKITLTSKNKNANMEVSLAVLNWKDRQNFCYTPADSLFGEQQCICTEKAVEDKQCGKEDFGKFVIKDRADGTSIQTWKVELNSDNNYEDSRTYDVKETGYFCVSSEVYKPIDAQYTGTVEWINPYGLLPASEYPKMTFYAGLCIVYLVVALLWSIAAIRYRQDILPIQYYITGVMFYLIFEMAANWGYLRQYNITGNNPYILLSLVVIMDAAKNSLCFFILLIVCLGYGVLKPSLGSTMRKCQILTFVHFVCGCLYGASSMLVDIDAAGLMILVYVVPLSLSMTIFYVWILQALNRTTSQLEAKQQHEKIKMFKRLKFTLGFSIALLLLFFVANSITISGYTDDEWISNQWKSRWFMVDGWLALLFFTIFLVIAILWRPTQNNQRYGLQQLAQDEVSADALDLESRYNAQPTDRGTAPGATTGEVNPAALQPHVLEDDEGDIFDIGGDDSDEDMIPKDQRNRS